jgi:hypothetical protein
VLEGKSTLALLLTDDQSLRAEENLGEYTIVQENPGHNNVIGTETSVSHTTFPEAFVDKENDIVYYDCPGFADSRQATPHVEIANAIFLKNVADHAKKLKVLVAVNHFSVRRSADRSDFLETLTLVKNLFNITAFKGCIGLLVTKVEHQASDQQVIGYIAEFLMGVERNLQITSSQEDLEQRKLLLEEFLQKDASGAYDRISIFRRASATGPLSTNEPIQKNKRAIREMVTSLEAKSHDDDDVGYVLSTRAKLLTKDVHSQLREQTMGKITLWSERLNQSLVEELDPETTQKEAWSARQLEHNFELCQLPAKQEMSTLEQITDFMSKFQPAIDREAEDVIANDARAMSFLQQVDTSIRINSWTEANQVLQKVSGSINKSLKMKTGNVLESLTRLLKKQYPRSFPTENLPSTEQLTSFVKRHLSCIANHKQEKMKRWQLNETVERGEALNGINAVLSCFEVIKPENNNEEAMWLKDKIVLMAQSPRETYDLLNARLWQPMEVFFGNFLLTINRFSVKFDDVKKELEVQGDVLSMKKVVNSPEVTLYRGTMRKLLIVARHTIFLDTQVNGTDLNEGESFDLTIVSPIWWASPGHKINLDGKPGAMYPNTTRQFGAHGRPGARGGNAGSFFGLGLDFRGTNLTVSAKGGDGGPGEDGANGAPGQQGKMVESPSCTSIGDPYVKIMGGKFGFECRSPSNEIQSGSSVLVKGGPGSPGGDGGHGGQGGYGGQGGRVLVLRLTEKQNSNDPCNGGQLIVYKVFGAGAKGPNGKGGIGGQGGVEGFKTAFEARTVQHGNRRRKRFLNFLFPAIGVLLAGKALSGGGGGGHPSPQVIHRTEVRHVQVACLLEALGIQNKTTSLLARAAPGNNGTAGFFKSDDVTTTAAQSTKQSTDWSCSSLMPSVLQVLLTSPDSRFEF